MCIENQWIGVAVVINSKFSTSIMTAPYTTSNDKSVVGVVMGTVAVEVEVTFPIAFNVKAENCHATTVALCTNNSHDDPRLDEALVGVVPLLAEEEVKVGKRGPQELVLTRPLLLLRM